MQTAWRAWVRYVIPAKTALYKRFAIVLVKTRIPSGLRVFDIPALPRDVRFLAKLSWEM